MRGGHDIRHFLKLNTCQISQLPYFSGTGFHLSIILLAVISTRIAYILSPLGQTGGADEAVFGLMAQQIQSFKEFPIYCWEAHYAGAVVSYVAAVIFSVWGSGFPQLRMAMFPAVIITPVLFYLIYRKLFEPLYALVGTLFLVFCPFMVFYYTFSAHGGYGETYLGTALIVYLSRQISEKRYHGDMIKAYAALGFCCGFFFYILFLIVPAIVAFAMPTLFPFKKKKKETIVFLSGGILGILPMVIYNLTQSGGTVIRAASRSMDMGREAMQMTTADLIKTITVKKLEYLHDWMVDAPRMAGQYLVPDSFGSELQFFLGIFLLAVLILFIIMPLGRLSFPGLDTELLFQFKIFLVVLFLFQWVANLNRARHLLPILIVIPVALFTLCGTSKTMKKTLTLALIVFCAVNAYDLKAHMRHPMFDPRPVVDLMRREGVDRFYGSYWTVYPIMFASRGQIKGAPYLLKPREILSDRRPESSKIVANAISPAFVFSADEKKMKHDFEAFLFDKGIQFKSLQAGSATFYWALTKPVHIVIDKSKKAIFKI